MICTEPQFSIFLINKPGVLAAITSALAKERINITALSMMDSVELGVLRIVCDDPARVRKLLNKTHDHWTEAKVLLMEMDNRPGVFARAARKLAEAHVSIAYAYTTGGSEGRTRAVFKVADMKKAFKVLSELGATKKRTAKSTRKTRTGQKGRSK